MVVVGSVLFVVSIPVGRVSSYLVPVIDGLLIVLGVLLLAGRNPFNRLSGMRVPLVANPYGQAYAYGVMLGPIALPCAGPFLAALLAVSVGVGDAIAQIGTFVVFGLGLGCPWCCYRCSRAPASATSFARSCRTVGSSRVCRACC